MAAATRLLTHVQKNSRGPIHTQRLLFSFHESMVNFPFTKRETVVNFVTVRQKSLWTGGRAAEGTGLLNRRTGYTGTAGSNPALSVT